MGKTGQYENTRIGITGRLDTLQAAILSGKLKIFDQELDKRQAIANIYRRELNDVVITPAISPGYRSSWSVYTIRSAKRDQNQAAFQSKRHSISRVLSFAPCTGNRPLRMRLAVKCCQ